MKVSNLFKKRLIEELRFIVKKMDETEDPGEACYYFSAVHGVIQRVLNFEFNSDLVFLHVIIHLTYNSFVQLTAKGSNVIDKDIYSQQLNRLIELTARLADVIEEGEDIHSIAKEFALLQYSTTGNGTYLVKKGLLEF